MEEYLDGELTPEATRALEADLQKDPAAARLLASLKTERAIRAAAYQSYQPTQAESARLAAKVMMTATAPVGFVGPRWRRMVNVAAGFIILAGTFATGYLVANSHSTETPEAIVKMQYTVISYPLGTNEPQERVFDSVEQCNNYVKELEQNGSVVTSIAEGPVNPVF